MQLCRCLFLRISLQDLTINDCLEMCVFVKGSVDIIWIGQVKCGDNIIKKRNTLEKGKYSRNICLWAEMKREKNVHFFWKIWESGKMTQHTNRFSQQQAIPQAWRAFHENSTAVQLAGAWREGALMVMEEGSLGYWVQPHGYELPALTWGHEARPSVQCRSLP